MAEKQFGICVSEGDGKYVALEVLREKTYTKAGDIFSLGIMMLEIASDVALPGSGPEWVKIREGDVPTCYTNRSKYYTSILLYATQEIWPKVKCYMKNYLILWLF